MRSLVLILLLAGCAAPTMQQIDHTTVVRDPSSYTRGYKAGKTSVYQRLQNDPATHVSEYALAPCDQTDAFLPREGHIEAIQFFRALRREQWLKNNCSDRHNALRGQVKSTLGVIRQGTAQ